MPQTKPRHMKLCVWILWAAWTTPVSLIWLIRGTYATRLAFAGYVTGVLTGWIMYQLAVGATSREADAVSKQTVGLGPATANAGGQNLEDKSD